MNYKNITQLLEPAIKAMLLNHLKDKGSIDQSTTVINEFTLDSYSRRVDIALVNKKNLTAFEIKSEADSLIRLDGQTKKYLEYFDKVTIVAASKHINNIMKNVPENVAVWEIFDGQLKVKRRGRTVPITNKNKIIGLMKANELLRLSNRLGLSIKSKNRRSAEQALKNTSVSALKKAALQCVKERFHMTYSLFWEHVKTNKVLPEHINLLSPYKNARQSQKRAEEEKELFWNNWAPSPSEDPHLMTMSQKESNQIFGRTPKLD